MRRLWGDTDDRCDVIPQKCGLRPLAVIPWGHPTPMSREMPARRQGRAAGGSRRLLPAGAGRRARAGGKWLGHALLIFVPAMFSASLMGSAIQPTEVVGAVRNT
jgi:hypothetical protein